MRSICITLCFAAAVLARSASQDGSDSGMPDCLRCDNMFKTTDDVTVKLLQSKSSILCPFVVVSCPYKNSIIKARLSNGEILELASGSNVEKTMKCRQKRWITDEMSEDMVVEEVFCSEKEEEKCPEKKECPPPPVCPDPEKKEQCQHPVVFAPFLVYANVNANEKPVVVPGQLSSDSLPPEIEQTLRERLTPKATSEEHVEHGSEFMAPPFNPWSFAEVEPKK
ncbi:hypothetical protein RB195_025915 [Necator americanus]|uniref:Uncharacterized protein n=1 Tax=Necator americanus TaxID=51031 RepID=A0ABR1EWT7_NECAM